VALVPRPVVLRHFENLKAGVSSSKTTKADKTKMMCLQGTLPFRQSGQSHVGNAAMRTVYTFPVDPS
jgi:hypothetical protein